MRLIKHDNFWNDPFADIDVWMNRLFNNAALFDQRANAAPGRGIRVDSFAGDDAYQVVAELPGIPKDAINVTLENAVLTISGEHSSGQGEHARRYTFSRSITVGDDIDAGKVSAKHENGLLTITLPKAEERKPKAITVN